MPENNSLQQHSGSCLKKHGECNTCEATFFPLYCPPEKRLVLLPHVSLGFDKFIFIKNTSKTAFYDNSQAHAVDIPLFCVLAWSRGLTQGVLLNWCALTWAKKTRSAVFVWKATLKNGDFFFWHLQIKRDMSYLCSNVAAKSLSPCGTKQGFVVGFARAAQCFCVKHPKL